jgi:hypothetical protein
VPEDVLRRLNQYDQEVNEAVEGKKDAKQTYDSMEDFFDRFWRLELPVTREILLSVHWNSLNYLKPLFSPRIAGPARGHSYPPPEQPAARQVAQLRAQTSENHGRGYCCRIM